MGKSFKGFSKALSLILAVAMVVTCVPTSAYAADLLAGESEDLLISNDNVAEEASDALVDASASEDNSSTSIDTQKATAPSSEPDENTAGEEEFGPDGYTADGTIGIASYKAYLIGDTDSLHAAAFTIAGQKASLLGGATTGSTGSISFDSENGTSFYIVPFKGYELPATPFTAAGSYAYTGKTAVNLASSDYTNEDSDVSYAVYHVEASADDAIAGVASAPSAVNYDEELDWAAGRKITFKKGTAFATAFTDKKTGKTFDTNPSVTFTLAAATPKNFKFQVTGLDDGSQNLTATYDSGKKWALDSFREDWTNVSAKVIITDADGTETKLNPTTSTDVDGDTTTTAKYNLASNNDFSVNKTAVNAAYDVITAGGTVVLSLTQDVSGDQHSFEAKESDLVTFTDVNAGSGTGQSVTPVQSLDDGYVTYDSTPSNSYTYVNVARKASTDSTRSITGVFATVTKVDGTVTKVTAAALSNATPINGDTPASTNPAKVPDADGGTYVFDNNDFDGTVEIYAETTEEVSVTVDDKASGAVTSAEVIGTSGGIHVYNNAGSAYSEDVKTGDKLVLTITPGTNKEIKSVTVSSYNVKGDTPTTSIVTGEFGKYTITVTGRTEIAVKTKDVEGAPQQVQLASGTTVTGATVLDKKTGKEIITSSALAEMGKPYEFAVKATYGYSVKSVSFVSGTEPSKSLTVGNPDSEGVYSFTIPTDDVKGGITLTVTMDGGASTAASNSVMFNKFKNPNATVTINGNLVGDDKNQFIVLGDGASITVDKVGSAEITAVSYIVEDKKSDITSGSTFIPLNAVDSSGKNIDTYPHTYNLGDGVLKSLYSAADTEVYIVVQTKSSAPTGYTATWAWAGRGAASTDPWDGETISLYAGGAEVTDARADDATVDKIYGEANVTASFKTAEGKAVTGTSVSSTYKLGIEGTKAIATVAGSTITSAAKVGNAKATDTYTVETLDGGFPHALAYTATRTVEVNPLNTYYGEKTGLSLLKQTTDKGKETGDLNDDDHLTEAGLDGTGMIRVAFSTINDQAEFQLQAIDKNYTDGSKHVTKVDVDGSGTDTLIKSIKWSTTPEYRKTMLNPTFKIYTAKTIGASNEYDTANSSDKIFVNTATKAQDVTVTATITYKDDTTQTVSDILSIVDTENGYVAVPVTKAGVAESYNNNIINLETRTGGISSATVNFKVYEIISGTWAAASDPVTKITGLDEDDIDDLLAAGTLKEVATSKVDFSKTTTEVTDIDGVATITGTDTINATAKKQSTTPAVIEPVIFVDGVRVATADIFVLVAERLASSALTLKTEDGSGGTGYKYPQLKTDAAWLKYPKTISKSLDSTDQKLEAIVFENAIAGETFKLPTQSDFDAMTIDPGRALAGWNADVTVTLADGSMTQYLRVGDEFVMPDVPVVFTPAWAAKYDTTEAVALVDADTLDTIAATDNIATGAKKSFAIRVNELDLEAERSSVAAVRKSGDDKYTYIKVGLVITSSDEDVIKVGEDKRSIEVLKKGVENPVITATYTEGDDTTAPKKVWELKSPLDTVGSKGKVTYTTIDPTGYTLAVSDIAIEATQVKAVDVVYTADLDTANPKTPIEFNDAIITGVSVEFTPKDQKIVEVDDADLSTANHVLVFKGLQTGTTKATITVINNEGIEKTAEVNITVSEATYKITGLDEDNTVVDSANGWAVKDGCTADATANVLTLVAKKKNGSKWDDVASVAGDWTVTNSTVLTGDDAVPTTLRAIDDSTTETGYTAGKGVKIDSTDAAAKLITKANSFGYGEITLEYSPDGKVVYEQAIPVYTCYELTYKAPGAADKDSFSLYKGTEKVDDTIDQNQKIIYSGADSYTINFSDYSARWIDETTNKSYIGWSTSAATLTNGNIGETVAYAKDESITLEKGEVAGNAIFTTYYATFAEPELAVTGLPEEIVLSEEKLTKNGVAGTDAAAFTLYVTPPKSSSQIDIDADDSGLLVLSNSDTTETTAAVNNTSVYDGSNPVQFNTPATGSAPSRVHVFTVGAAENLGATPVGFIAGKTNLLVTYNRNTVKIPVYVNGEYADGFEVDGTTPIYRYMEKGNALESGMRIVRGKEHYYSGGKKILSGVLTLDEGPDKGKVILIVNGDRDKTAGVKTVGEDRYYVGADGFIKTGGIFAGEKTGTGADTDKTYYADGEGKLASDKLVEVSGKKYFFKADGAMAKASATADTYELVEKYYVDKDGNVAIGEIFKVAGKDRLFREDGTIVVHTDSDVKGGKITVNGVTYIIADDDTAKRDDVFYAAKVTWTQKYDSKFTKGSAAPVLKYKITYTSANTGTTTTTEEKSVTATSTDDYSATSVAKEITFTATADLTGYFVDKEGKTPATADPLKKTYKFDGDKPDSKAQSDSGKTESEPEESTVASYKSFNLFYKGQTIPVPGLASVSGTSTGKWTNYYEVDGDGVVLKNDATMDAKTAKAAASASNSLVQITTEDGEFTYQLPVYYQKPTLKLTATKGTVKTGVETELKTTVTEKKSTGLFEPVDVSDAVTLDSWKNASPELSTDGATVELKATGKGSGKLKVQPADWREDVKLSYSIAEKNADFLEADVKQVNFNANTDSGDDQVATILLNGATFDSTANVTAKVPEKFKSANIAVDGIDLATGAVDGSEIKFSYVSGSKPVKGNYSIKFTAGKSSVTVKVAVANTELPKAVALKVQTKMDMTTGQKMVLVPTLKGVGGPITAVNIENTSSKFEASYNDETNQIIVSTNDPKLTAGKYSETFTVEAGGVECKVALNFQVLAKKPGVKIAKVTLPKAKAIDGTAEGETNILATYKQGGKTFSVEPVAPDTSTPAVQFMNGKNAAVEDPDNTGWYKVNDNVLAQYDETDGKIKVKSIANVKGKGGSVKVNIWFANQSKPVTKSFSVGTK